MGGRGSGNGRPRGVIHGGSTVHQDQFYSEVVKRGQQQRGRTGFRRPTTYRNSYDRRANSVTPVKKDNSFRNRFNSLESDLANLRKTVESQGHRIEQNTRDIRVNDVRIFGVPINKDVSLIDMVKRVLEMMGISSEDSDQIISQVEKISRVKTDNAIIVSLGSAEHKQLVMEKKSTLKFKVNPWDKNKIIFLNHNYSAGQKSDADARKEFMNFYKQSGAEDKVEAVGWNLVKVNDGPAVPFRKI